MRIEGRTFLVTGGASGLGGATARMICEAGGSAVVLDVNAAAGEAAAAELGASARFVRADVADEKEVSHAIDVAREAFGGVSGVVNAAGVAPVAKVLGRQGSHPLDLFERTLRTNLVGTFNVIRLAAAAIAARDPEPSGERGVIVNTASIAAFDGQIGQVAYSASKGGVVGLTLPVARELARQGIRVVTIAPGTFDTPLLAGLPEAARVSLERQVPFPSRLGRPEEYASLVRHVIENEMLNGEVIRLDGALRMAPR